MKKIGIIGGGFSGIMLAAHLIRKSCRPFELIIIDKKKFLSKGIAYSSYSDTHLLNVSAGKMSAYPNEPDHFVDWVMAEESFKNENKKLLAGFYLPRKLYGRYISHIWEGALQEASAKGIKVSFIDAHAEAIELNGKSVLVYAGQKACSETDYLVISTGNHLPGNPKIQDMEFYNSPRYFQNPWASSSVKDIDDKFPVLILGNGLTMVDVVFGITEQGYKGKIISLSPNGFNILSHKQSYAAYDKLEKELKHALSLFELFKLIHKHIKDLRRFGLSAEPVIDSLRPHAQKIWKSLSDREKKIFMSRLRHLWGVARHRLPLSSFDEIQRLRIEKKLQINSGRLLNLTEKDNHVIAEYFDKKANKIKTVKVSRVINCTGPETDLMRLDKHFLKDCLINGTLTQDKLKLGIKTDTETFQILKADGSRHSRLFTLGVNLKGELWESTAIPELRVHAEKLALNLAKALNSPDLP